MATTKIWKCKTRLDNVINYIVNEKKTNEKTYVSGINCDSNIAYEEMISVKKEFFKLNGIQCFHAYQSFAENEVSPGQAHEIGVRLAQELWGDRFQVVVSTHLNTNHIHNHFVLNSVSFKDGKRFNNTKKDYALMRKKSDELCEEYNLNVIKNKEKEQEKYNKFATSSLYKELMKDSIDYAIENANNYEEFKNILRDLEYIVSDKDTYISIRKEPYKRNTRIERQFGKQYSKENINKRILETQPLIKYSNEPYLLINRTYEKYNKFNDLKYQKYGSFLWLLYHYEQLLQRNNKNVLKTNVTKMTPELLHELKQMDEFSEQAKFLATNNIENEEELNNFEIRIYKKINPLKSERENLWRKHKRSKTDEERKEIENKIIEMSKQITPLNNELKHCTNIRERMDKIKEYEVKEQIKIKERIKKIQEQYK